MGESDEIRGKTYTLLRPGQGSQAYYTAVRKAVDTLIKSVPDRKKLLSLLRASHRKSLLKKLTSGREAGELADLVTRILHDHLSAFIEDVGGHIKGLGIRERFDPVLATKDWQYLLYMAEIELVNRIYAEDFRKAEYKFSLIGHCLRDFRPECEAIEGDIEKVCQGCTEDCFINLGGELMRRYGIHPYISVEMDQETLFKEIKARHPSVGALGIACVPELARGMRLCIRLGIPPVGIPLDANRCARWTGSASESSFDLGELEELLKA
jgi:hypothetical protein